MKVLLEFLRLKIKETWKDVLVFVVIVCIVHESAVYIFYPFFCTNIYSAYFLSFLAMGIVCLWSSILVLITKNFIEWIVSNWQQAKRNVECRKAE